MDFLKIKLVNNLSHWDKFILNKSPWSFFQSYAWGDVQRLIGIEVMRFGVYDRDKMRGAFQMFIIKARRGTFIHVRHGPVFDTRDPHALVNYWNLFTHEMVRIAHEKGAFCVRVSPMYKDDLVYRQMLGNLHYIPAPIHRLDFETCWLLDLQKNEADLFTSMRKTTRYLIRQAIKLGVEVEISQNIDAFLRLYERTTVRHHFIPHKGIREEYSIYTKNKQGILLLGKYRREVLSGALIIFFGNQAIYHHGASLASKIPASYLLQWVAIQEARKRKLKFYNFGGIAPPNVPRHPWRGLSLFKRGFGGEEIHFIHAHDLPTSPLYGVSYTLDKIRKIVRGYE